MKRAIGAWRACLCGRVLIDNKLTAVPPELGQLQALTTLCVRARGLGTGAAGAGTWEGKGRGEVRG